MKRINEIGKRGYFGELALMNDAPRIASVRWKAFKNIVSTLVV
jgi:CRP-like cAMP-binding protein